MAPGNNITGGRRRSGKTTKGDVWLSDILTHRAWAASRSRDTYLSAQFWRLARRIGKKKVAVAVGHSILVICWYLLTEDADYDDLSTATTSAAGPTRPPSGPAHEQLQQLGYHVPPRPRRMHPSWAAWASVRSSGFLSRAHRDPHRSSGRRRNSFQSSRRTPSRASLTNFT